MRKISCVLNVRSLVVYARRVVLVMSSREKEIHVWGMTRNRNGNEGGTTSCSINLRLCTLFVLKLKHLSEQRELCMEPLLSLRSVPNHDSRSLTVEHYHNRRKTGVKKKQWMCMPGRMTSERGGVENSIDCFNEGVIFLHQDTSSIDVVSSGSLMEASNVTSTGDFMTIPLIPQVDVMVVVSLKTMGLFVSHVAEMLESAAQYAV
eukprot:scaffold23225_cov158-Skeletonema_dohrnii-CCMP3373.AAC.1